jgi:hypothetical protein
MSAWTRQKASRVAGALWGFFWLSYFVCTSDTSAFVTDYYAAWEQHLQANQEVIVFIDNENRFAFPCRADLDDKHLLKALRIFYHLAKAKRGIFESMGARSCERIDIVHVLAPLIDTRRTRSG